jgi:magnesium transporter
MIVDCAHYHDGVRQHEGPMSLGEVAACPRGGADLVWLGLLSPSEEEMRAVQEEFGLHDLAVEDAFRAHQRPKLEDYEGMRFVVLKTARYDDRREQVRFGEIDIFAGPGFAITVRHGEAGDLRSARRRLEARPELLRAGPAAVVWAILDKVVDDYRPVVDGLENDIEEVEEAVFSDEGEPTQRIYFLKRQVIEFHHAVRPLLAPLDDLERGIVVDLDPQLTRYFRDVNDHVKRIAADVEAQRELLTSVLEANLALVAVRQNEVVRKISGWAAIIAVPTFIASVYGMNFNDIPELSWAFGYPLAWAVMLGVAALLYVVLKRARWL